MLLRSQLDLCYNGRNHRNYYLPSKTVQAFLTYIPVYRSLWVFCQEEKSDQMRPKNSRINTAPLLNIWTGKHCRQNTKFRLLRLWLEQALCQSGLLYSLTPLVLM